MKYITLLLAVLLTLTACGETASEMRVASWGPVLTDMTESEILAYFEHCTGLKQAEYLADYGGLYLDGGKAVMMFRVDSDVLHEAESSLEDNTDFRVLAVKYTDTQLDAVKEWLRKYFPFFGEYVIREISKNQSDNCIDIGVEVGTDIPAFTKALMDELDMPEIGADIFNIYEFDPADEVS